MNAIYAVRALRVSLASLSTSDNRNQVRCKNDKGDNRTHFSLKMAPTELARKILLTDNILGKLRILNKFKKKRKSKHEIYKDRLHFGEFHHLYAQLRADENAFRQYTRMIPSTFDYIVETIRDSCYHCSTNFQVPISVQERLFLTLR